MTGKFQGPRTDLQQGEVSQYCGEILSAIGLLQGERIISRRGIVVVGPGGSALILPSTQVQGSWT
jgi:hypothetical protein